VLTMMVAANNYQYWSRSSKNMKIKTTEAPSYNNLISELNKRLSRLESILNGAPIADAKIASIKWNKAQGGTATLGGEDNVNGVLTVKDAAGVEKVVIDKDGVVINDGVLSIKNDSGVTILDSLGLVGNVNFPSGNASGNTEIPFTTGSLTTVTGSTINFNTPRDNCKVLVTLSVQSASAQVNTSLNMSGRVVYFAKLDSTLLVPEILYDAFLTVSSNVRENVTRKSYSTAIMVTVPTAGAHTLLAQYQQATNTNMQSSLYKWDLSYVLLGS
jgi:hypothetical protein